jgi:hypothetical protein
MINEHFVIVKVSQCTSIKSHLILRIPTVENFDCKKISIFDNMLHLLASFFSYIDKKDMEIRGYISETEVSIFVGYFRKPLGDKAGHSSRAIKGMNCLCSLGPRDGGFESQTVYGCLVCVCVCVVLCLGSGLTTSGSHVQGVLPSMKNDFGNEYQTRALNGLEESWKSIRGYNTVE